MTARQPEHKKLLPQRGQLLQLSSGFDSRRTDLATYGRDPYLVLEVVGDKVHVRNADGQEVDIPLSKVSLHSLTDSEHYIKTHFPDFKK
jgi:hypothetical protein